MTQSQSDTETLSWWAKNAGTIFAVCRYLALAVACVAGTSYALGAEMGKDQKLELESNILFLDERIDTHEHQIILLEDHQDNIALNIAKMSSNLQTASVVLADIDKRLAIMEGNRFTTADGAKIKQEIVRLTQEALGLWREIDSIKEDMRNIQ